MSSAKRKHSVPSHRIADMKGKTYGLLFVVERAASGPSGLARWKVLCACGTEKIVTGSDLRRGSINSCGCLKSAAHLVALNTTHGLSDRHEHAIWAGMKKRCHNPKDAAYSRYGGRGITVCAEWLNDFEAFLAHIGPRPSPDHSVDRIDNERGYEPHNVRWATAKEQANNRRPRASRGR